MARRYFFLRCICTLWNAMSNFNWFRWRLASPLLAWNREIFIENGKNPEKEKRVIFKNILIYFSFFMIKNWFRTKKYSCIFSQKLIVEKIQIGPRSKVRAWSIFDTMTVLFFISLNGTHQLWCSMYKKQK